MLMPTENYVCFYTTNPFWAGETPDLAGAYGGVSDAGSCRLPTIMSAEVFTYTTEAYTIKVCKDGLLMVQTTHLEQQLQEPAAAPRDADGSGAGQMRPDQTAPPAGEFRLGL